jgi:hypothetical protein
LLHNSLLSGVPLEQRPQALLLLVRIGGDSRDARREVTREAPVALVQALPRSFVKRRGQRHPLEAQLVTAAAAAASRPTATAATAAAAAAARGHGERTWTGEIWRGELSEICIWRGEICIWSGEICIWRGEIGHVELRDAAIHGVVEAHLVRGRGRGRARRGREKGRLTAAAAPLK